VVGWAIADHMRTELVLSALSMALLATKPGRGLIFHSDRGSQYASHAYRDALKDQGALSSMSRKGDCYDNAVAESFFASLKQQLLYRSTWATHDVTIEAIGDYIDRFYNTRRLRAVISITCAKIVTIVSCPASRGCNGFSRQYRTAFGGEGASAEERPSGEEINDESLGYSHELTKRKNGTVLPSSRFGVRCASPLSICSGHRKRCANAPARCRRSVTAIASAETGLLLYRLLEQIPAVGILSRPSRAVVGFDARRREGFVVHGDFIHVAEETTPTSIAARADHEVV
jgi:hypothetical protein